MYNLGFKKWLIELPYIVLGLWMIYFLCTHAPNLEYDTTSYVTFNAIRPPLYPTFIWLFHWAGAYQFSLIIWVQGILLFGTLLYARYWLKKYLQLTDCPVFLVCLFTVLTISFHFQIWYIQSEGLSFPFFIWTFFLLIECFQRFSLKKLAYLSLWVGVLVLTRLQFYYFYVIFGVLGVWYLWQRVPFKSVCMAIFLLFGSAALTTVIDHGYHYFKHGFFGTAPTAGSMIIVQALYLSDSNAASYFQNPDEKQYVQMMLDQINQQHFNQDAALLQQRKLSYLQYAYESYDRNFIEMQTIVYNTFGNVPVFEANKIEMNIAKTLFTHAPQKNIAFFLWKFVQCVGGGVPFFLFFVILLFAIPFKIVKDKVRAPELAAVFVMVAVGITFLNAAMIAMVERALPSYFCYSQFMLYCLAAFLADRAFRGGLR